jgi:hypothetical protein
MDFLPRVIRAKDAPAYLGMDRNRFQKEIKPYLLAVAIGSQGIGYDRIDMDLLWEQYKRRNGRPGALYKEGEGQWEEAQRGSVGAPTRQAVSGISTRSSTAAQFTKAVEQATKLRRKGT